MEAFIGTIQAFGFNFPPRGWAPCDGRQLSIAQWSAVFSLLGTQFGGNGQTTFALPDLRGRHMVNQGQGPGLQMYTIGQTGGAESTTLTQGQMPMHTHIAVAQPHTHSTQAHTHTNTATSALFAERLAGNLANPNGNMMASAANMYLAPAAQNNVQLAADSITTAVTIDQAAVTLDPATVTVTNSAAGGSQPFDNRPPYLCVNICICLEGIFPSRN